MWKRLQQFFDRIESRWSLYSLLTGSGIMGIITGWLASGAEWLDGYGAIAWWFAALVGAALFAFAFLGVAWGRWKLIQAKAVNRWSKEVNLVNPMEKEFRNQRIKLSELANPITNQIVGKRFINCELIGPATILLGPCEFRRSGFFNVTMIPLRDGIPIFASYHMINCELIESNVFDMNLLFPKWLIPTLEAGFAGTQLYYASLTGIPEIDNRSLQGTGSETPL